MKQALIRLLSISPTLVFLLLPSTTMTAKKPDLPCGRPMMLDAFERQLAGIPALWLDGTETPAKREARQPILQGQVAEKPGLRPMCGGTDLRGGIYGTVEHGSHETHKLNPTRIIPLPDETLVVPPIRPDRPRLMFTPGTLELMRERIRSGQQPWSRAAEKIMREAETGLTDNRNPQPNTGRHSLEFYHDAVREGEYARLQGYAWLLSGDDRFAREAIRYLVAWATAEPTPASDFDPDIRYPNTGMEVARAAIPFLETYDLLADHPALRDGDKKAVEAWFRLFVHSIMEGKRRWRQNDYFGRQEFQNHLTAHTMGLAAIGCALGDRELVQFAFDHPDNDRDFKKLIAGMIFMPGDPPHHREPDFAPPPQRGEIHDRYRHFSGPHRGLQYAHLSLSQMLYLAEIAWNNGIDFYRHTDSGGENLLYPLRFYADFFRTKDASLKGGFYAQDRAGRFPGDPDHNPQMDESGRIGDWEPAIFEIGNRHYPNTPEIESLLRSLDRPTVPRHPHSYFFYPVLTHGEPLEP